MRQAEKIAKLKLMVDETDDEVLDIYLGLAANTIIRVLYPYGDGTEQMPEQYANTQLEIAAYKLNKRGAEGQMVHNENGINRQYKDPDVPESMLKGLFPYVGVI